MNEYWWENFKGRVENWWYNLMTDVGGGVVRLFGIAPRCECGWRLAQRNDGTWLCGHCFNVAFPEHDVLRGRRTIKDWPCECMFCTGVVRESQERQP